MSPRRRLGWVLAAVALVRLPALAWGVISDDEAIYAAMGHAITRGAVMYHDTVDHKPPGLAYTYAACRRLAEVLGLGSGPGPGLLLVHLVGLVAAVLTALGLYGLGRRFFDERRAAFAALLYGVVSVARQPCDGLAVNGELLMNLPVVLSVLAVLEASRRRDLAGSALHLLAGGLVGLAALYKYQAALVGVAFPLAVIEAEARRGSVSVRDAIARSIRPLFLASPAWLLGLALPFASVAAYFHHRGLLDDAVFWGLRFNRDYLGQGPGLLHGLERFALQVLGLVLPGVAVYAGALWTLRRWLERPSSGAADRWNPPLATAAAGPASDGAEPQIGHGRLVLGAWALVSVWAVTLGGRFFGHYFLHAEPPLSLMAAGPVAALALRAPRRTAILALPAVFFTVLACLPSRAHALFSGDDPDYERIGAYVRDHTRPDETIWVWGNVPQIYVAADRVQGVRFSFCNYLSGLSPATPSEYDPTIDPSSQAVPASYAMARADLDRNKPAVLVDTAAHDLKRYGRFPLSRYPLLRGAVERDYQRGETVAGAVLYWRRDRR